MSDAKNATLHRMVLPDHVCPYGVRAKELLEEAGYTVDDRLLRTREEVDSFERNHGVATTPLILIDGEPVGGCDALELRLRADATPV